MNGLDVNVPTLWTSVIADVSIAIAYFAIPLELLYFFKFKYNISIKPIAFILWMFIAFIFLCGVSHATTVYVMFSNRWIILAVVKVLTAIVSVMTAVSLSKFFAFKLFLSDSFSLQQE